MLILFCLIRYMLTTYTVYDMTKIIIIAIIIVAVVIRMYLGFVINSSFICIFLYHSVTDSDELEVHKIIGCGNCYVDDKKETRHLKFIADDLY